MRRAAAASAVVALLLAGCSEETPQPSTPTSSVPTPADATPSTSAPPTSPTTSEEPTPPSPTPTRSSNAEATTPTPSQVTSAPSTTPEPDDVDALHPWLTESSQHQGSGDAADAPQEIIDVRVGEHDGYDRVVFDLSGDQPRLGWFAGFTNEAIEDPTGNPLDVDGDAFLQLGINGIDWAREAPERYSGETIDADDLEVVEEVVFGGLFEGQQQVLIGLDEETAYRVFTLSGPARIVVDVRHD